MSGLLIAVDAAFARTAAGLAPWPDPHDGRAPADDEYSRVTDPGKWRILGARAEAWLDALAGAGLADVDPAAHVTWAAGSKPRISRVTRAVPRARGAMALVVARSELGDVDDAGVVLGVGDPAQCIAWFPQCGCDACDSGSTGELDHVDTHMRAVVSGSFRRLSRGVGEITVLGDAGWSASNVATPGRRGWHAIEAVLADPRGWDELSGSSWLDAG